MRNDGHEICPLSALNLNNEVNNDFIWNHLQSYLCMKFIKLVALVTISKIKRILPWLPLQTIKQRL